MTSNHHGGVQCGRQLPAADGNYLRMRVGALQQHHRLLATRLKTHFNLF